MHILFPIEHSENKVITHSALFQNEIGPGVRSTVMCYSGIPKAKSIGH